MEPGGQQHLTACMGLSTEYFEEGYCLPFLWQLPQWNFTLPNSSLRAQLIFQPQNHSALQTPEIDR
jgi:hypothetical protein